jgi:hypothetical protein
MPLIHDVLPSRGPRVVIRPSVAVELQWALSAANRPDYHPVLATVYERHPDLGERVRSFWDDEVAITCDSFLELMVLAHHGALLFSTDAALLLGRLGDLCLTAPRDLRLGSESEADRLAILARLAQLRSSEDRRLGYVQLLTDVWSALEGAWEREGRGAVEAAIAARQDLVTKGAPWPEVVRPSCDFDGLLPRLVDDLGPSGELAVVPAFFTHQGLLVDLPGVVVVGVRTDQSGAESRQRTELLARRLKSLSDPTRLAILDSLSRHPGTVTEIATSFGLAQPTVSNHVKLLRDAGLIANATIGGGGGGTRNGSRDLLVQNDAVADLLQQLQSVLRPPSEQESTSD